MAHNQAEAILAIKQWGNNIGVRIPQSIARTAHLHRDQRVKITVEKGCVKITPVDTGTPSLEEMIASFDPARHGGEVMITEPAGVEEW